MSAKWVPLESNPDVFNTWARSLGLPDHPLSFQDVLSLDSDFLSLIPLPFKAVLFLFPDSPEIVAAHKKEEEEAPKWEGDSVWWIKQTIRNVCGSIAILHALMNLPSSGQYALKADSPLIKFKQETMNVDAEARAKHLESAEFFEIAHKAGAHTGQSAETVDPEGHFIAFVEGINSKGEKRVVELSGGRSGPFDHGECTSLLHDVADVIRTTYIPLAKGDLGFSVIVLARERQERSD